MNKYLAEMVGTFVLTFLGCGAAVSLNCGVDTASVVGTAMAFGISVIAMAYTIGGISGCPINPAITLCVFLSGRMNGKDAGMYMVFQTIGAIIAAAVLSLLVWTDPSLVEGTATGANACASNNVFNGLLAEVLLTFLFVLVVLGATSKTNGPALFQSGQALSQLWVFIVGPFAGGALAAGVWKMIAPDGK